MKCPACGDQFDGKTPVCESCDTPPPKHPGTVHVCGNNTAGASADKDPDAYRAPVD